MCLILDRKDLNFESSNPQVIMARFSLYVQKTWPIKAPFIHSFIHSFIHAFIYSFIHSFVYSFIHRGLQSMCAISQILDKANGTKHDPDGCWHATA